MSTKDVIKNSILKQFGATDISPTTIIIALLITTVLAVYIFFVYRAMSKRSFYSKSFALTLVIVSIVTALIIMAIQSSVVISLGMVGALSIVRFRTAIKDPLDIAFIFWSISVGIICGAHLYSVAIIGSVFVTIVMVIIQLLPGVKPALLLIVNASSDVSLKDLEELISANTSYYKIKSRNITSSELDIIAEIRTQDEQAFIKLISDFNGINNATIMLHDGEVIC